MTYRDELRAAQERAEALERELEATRSELARLREKPGALAPPLPQALERAGALPTAADRWFGAPARLLLSREVEGEVPESAYAEIVETIRELLKVEGNVSTLPGSLTWTPLYQQQSATGPLAAVSVTSRRGKTRIRVEERLSNLAGGIFGGLGGGVGGGGIMLPVSVATFAPWMTPLAVAAWLGGVYGVCRRIYRRSARKRAARLDDLTEELLRVVRRVAVTPGEQGDIDSSP